MPGDNGAAHSGVFEKALAAGAGGIMTSYGIVADADGEAYYGDLRGSAYDKARVDIARVDNNYDGVIVTDWGVTASYEDGPDVDWGVAWGAEDLTVEERHFEILKAGVDQFGGNSDVAPVRAAFDMWEAAHKAGELDIDAATRWAETGRRVLANLFSVGLYDNPYTDLDAARAVAGNAEAVAAGLDAQRRSVVRVKAGEGITCGAAASDYADMKVYIPRSFEDTRKENVFVWDETDYSERVTVSQEVAERYFGEVVTDDAAVDGDGHVTAYTAPDLSDVDLVVVGMKSPQNGSWDPVGPQLTVADDGTRTWRPISLQYRPYTADGPNVRRTSIAGDILPDGSRENRSYFGQTSNIFNEADFDAFERAVAAVEASGKDIPIVVLLSISGSMVIPAEFEPRSDGIVLGFGVPDEALLDVALGIAESSGRLPVGLPASMDAVEASLEDVEKDVESYRDSAGNVYAFGFGLTCEGAPVK
jgi:beta-glucosidase